jgi:hypothetical protein
MKYYVYAYLRPNSYSPYYIGKGSGNRVNATHTNVIVPPPNRRVIIRDNLTQDQSLQLEGALVKFWGRMSVDGGVLLNKKHGFSAGNKLMGNTHALGKRYKVKRKYVLKRRKRRWWNDGVRSYHLSTCPEGCVSGRIPFDNHNIDNSGSKNPRAQKWGLTIDNRCDIIIALKEWCSTQPDINYNGLYYAWKNNKPYKYIKEIVKL